MAVAMPVRRRKQSDRLAATLYSPPETWISTDRALRKGITPGSSRWTTAPRARKSSVHGSVRIFRPVMDFPQIATRMTTHVHDTRPGRRSSRDLEVGYLFIAR